MAATLSPAQQAAAVTSTDEVFLAAMAGVNADARAFLAPSAYLERRGELLRQIAVDALEEQARAADGEAAQAAPERFAEGGNYLRWRQLLLQSAISHRRAEAEDQALRLQAAEAMHRAMQAEKEERERFAAGAADLGPRVLGHQYDMRVDRVLHLGSPVEAVAFASTGDRFAVCLASGVVQLCAASPPRIIATLTGHSHAVAMAAWGASDNYLLTTSSDRTARLWQLVPLDSLEAGEESSSPRAATAELAGRCVRIVYGEMPLDGGLFCPGNNNVCVISGHMEDAGAGGPGWLRTLNVSTGKLEQTIKVPGRVTSMAFSTDGEHLFVADSKGSLLQYRFREDQASPVGPSTAIIAGQGAAGLLSRRPSVELSARRANSLRKVPQGETAHITSIDFRAYDSTLHGPLLATVDTAMYPLVVQPMVGVHGGAIDFLGASSDGDGCEAVAAGVCRQSDLLVIAGPDRQISLVDPHAESGTLVSRLPPAHSAPVTALTWGNTDSTLVSADRSGDVVVWERRDSSSSSASSAEPAPEAEADAGDGEDSSLCPICGRSVEPALMLSHVEQHVDSPPAASSSAAAPASSSSEAEQPAPAKKVGAFAKLRRPRRSSSSQAPAGSTSSTAASAASSTAAGGSGKRFGFRRKAKK